MLAQSAGVTISQESGTSAVRAAAPVIRPRTFGDIAESPEFSDLTDWLTTDLVSPPLEGTGNLEKAAAFLDKTCGDNRGQLSVKNKENGIFMRCDDSVSLNSWFKGVYLVKIDDHK